MKGIETGGVDVLSEAGCCGKPTRGEQNRAEFDHDSPVPHTGASYRLIAFCPV
jgi:hypothetical protein